MAIRYAAQAAPADIQKHYTPACLAARLGQLVPVHAADVVLDPAAGPSKAFLEGIRARRRIAFDIEEGTDFLSTPASYDWAITNPPYHLLWPFIDKASREARRGFAFLVNINGINTLTPKRLALLAGRGFHMRRLHVCQVRQWFGRYYFYVFGRQAGACILSWDLDLWS
jgi:hypothetical protein